MQSEHIFSITKELGATLRLHYTAYPNLLNGTDLKSLRPCQREILKCHENTRSETIAIVHDLNLAFTSFFNCEKNNVIF